MLNSCENIHSEDVKIYLAFAFRMRWKYEPGFIATKQTGIYCDQTHRNLLQPKPKFWKQAFNKKLFI